MPRKLRADAILAVAAIVLIGIFAALQASLRQADVSEPSTFDYGGNGLAALYALLEREHVAVSRYEQPLGLIHGRRGAFVIAGTQVLLGLALDKRAQKTLSNWVDGGGTLVLAGARPPIAMFDLPRTHDTSATDFTTACAFGGHRLHVAAVVSGVAAGGCTATRSALLRSADGAAAAIAYRHGRGAIVYLTASSAIDNAHLALADNAAFAYQLFAALGPVAFDEQVYGYATGHTMWQVLPLPVHYAIFIAAFALLLGLIGANIRFAPPVVRAANRVRDTSEYVQSLAALLQRGGARSDVIARLARALDRAVGGRNADAKTAKMMSEMRMLSMQVQPNDDDVLAAARIFARFRKDA